MNRYIKEEGEKIAKRLTDIRRDIHMHPELGMEEFRTAKLVADVLRELHIDVEKGLCSTGVVGLLKGKTPGKTIAIRADMDALAIEEETEVAYKSTYPGKMHACGHDGHVAILLGAAMILSKIQDQLPGQVKFIFQPAEEKGPAGGAQFLVKEGVLKNPKVDVMVGFHIFPQIPAGKFSVKYGLMMASSDTFQIIIHGKGGHPGLPHQTIDAIAVSGQIITALQTIISRNVDPLEPAVISLGTIRGGSKHNIIANKVEIKGTARTFSKTLKSFVEERITNLVQGICQAMGAQGEVHYQHGYPHLKNDNDVVHAIETSLRDLQGQDNVLHMENPVMGSEDFSYYTHHVPSGFFILGGGWQDREFFPNHHPKFNFDEKILKLGAMGLSKIAFDYLKEDGR